MHVDDGYGVGGGLEVGVVEPGGREEGGDVGFEGWIGASAAVVGCGGGVEADLDVYEEEGCAGAAGGEEVEGWWGWVGHGRGGANVGTVVARATCW